MNNLAGIIGLIQIFFAVVIGLYFWNLLRSQQTNKVAVFRESRKEMDKLHQMKEIRLTEPLSEKTRPSCFTEIVGQEEGLKALKAALCGPNPQHVIIYGPPGIGKTAAARLVLEEAKLNNNSPFGSFSKFVELDATIARFDERGIADPLIGSVHDPIYQGAGPMGVAGIPQPKPGAVTKAHGGLLFIDEIGELHPMQMNKLLKVLEDRKVFLESAYYSSEDPNIPEHIHEMFERGLPADFRLVGATTRNPEEIPSALRSRCIEIFFRGLFSKEITIIAQNAAHKIDFPLKGSALDLISSHAQNGREAVNLIQIAAGLALGEGFQEISPENVEWVINNSHLSPRPEKKIYSHPQVGFVNGLAVYGPNLGTIIEIEVSSLPSRKGEGVISITGIVEEEERGNSQRLIRRKGMVKGSVENVLTLLRSHLEVDPRNYDIHVNFPGGVPLDGPSAGAAIAAAVYSSIKSIPISNTAAVTGEISIMGLVKPVGGVSVKIQAARQAGVKKVIIPEENWQQTFASYEDLEIVPVKDLKEVLDQILLKDGEEKKYQTAGNIS
ncbi:MAG: ATP-dependent protease LonB [Candidatus Syntrophonatronum acetioxidans]|uniref:endopeptidase La n=1 Tax=Candidatus Syntrophonatronum acetioxidans TaxID=1795816 RepID=A0A424YDN6_9FIRM|nr:MAG: ATP-dependent protease LonB [Candidatus Syntrophonatronum acetioxidans]